MDWNEVAKTAITAVGSGGSAFLGAFLRFKQRLKDAEDGAKAALALAQSLRSELSAFKAAQEALTKGWRLEFDGFKEDYERDAKHRSELERAVEQARASRPDPAEDLRRELEKLREQLEKMKEKQGRYVLNETFIEHARGQETQWKEIARTLGRLEALVR